MITDARAFREEFVPAEIVHREGAIDAISSALEPATVDQEPEDICISGPSGTGKTTTARYVLEELEREALGVTSAYANCMSATTAAGALHELLRDAGRGADLRRSGTPTETFLNRLRDLADEQQVVTVLDEVDVLDDQDLLTALYETSGVSMILITIDEDDLFASLNQRVRSRLGSSVAVRLDKYSHAEMVDILQRRADVGLEPGSITEDALDRIADLAAGDARLGIALLRRAAREGDTTIDVNLVEDVQMRARAAVHDQHVATLSTHQRLLYDIIEDASEHGISGSDLREEYERRAQDPKSDSRRRDYLNSLERYGLIESEGTGRAKHYFPATP